MMLSRLEIRDSSLKQNPSNRIMSPHPDLRRIVDIAPLVRAGQVSPVDLVEGCLAQVDANPDVNAFITRLDDAARADARKLDAETRSGVYRGPLHGIPISIKDL